MGLTLFSLFLLPLCLVWIVSPDRLLQLVAVASCFEAAAVLIIGNYGVQPGLMPAILFMAYMTLQMLLGAPYPAAQAVWQMFRPLALVALYAVVTAYLMPRLLAGQVYVWQQKPTPPFELAPLTVTDGYITQSAYLILNCGFALLAALYLSRPGRSLIPFVNAFFFSGFLVAAISIWQFAHRVFGVPFPDAVFFSNPSWQILSEQTIGPLPRINGTFAEPSSLGSFMASIVCASGWLLLKGRREPLIWLLFAAGLVTVVLSTSTTGFAALGVIAVAVPVQALLSGSSRTMAATMKVVLPLLLFGGMALLLAGILVPSFDEDMQQVVTSTLSKQDTASYSERTQEDLDSLALVPDTYGFGVGWGNNRSSSLVPGILAQVGIPGILGLLWFAFGIRARSRVLRRLPPTSELPVVMDTCLGAVAGFLLAASISAPTITSTVFFLLLGMLIACVARARQEVRDAGAWRIGHAPLAPGLPGGNDREPRMARVAGRGLDRRFDRIT